MFFFSYISKLLWIQLSNCDMADSFRVSVLLWMSLDRATRYDNVITAAVFPTGSVQLHVGHYLTSGSQGALMVWCLEDGRWLDHCSRWKRLERTQNNHYKERWLQRIHSFIWKQYVLVLQAQRTLDQWNTERLYGLLQDWKSDWK